MTDTILPDDFPNGPTDSPSKIYDDTDGNGVTTEVRGQIEQAGDQDWIPFNMAASKTYIIYLRGTNENQIGLDRIKKLDSPDLVGLYDASGLLLTDTAIEYADGYAFYRYKITESGTYYVAASSLNDDTGFYRLQFEPDSPTDDYSDYIETTARVTVGNDFSGEIGSSSDRDWVAVTLKAGTSYQFELAGTDTSAGTLTQPSLTGIYDANGVAVTGFDRLVDDGPGAGTTDILKYSPSESGTFYIGATGTGPNLFNTGTYTLSAKNVADDYGTTISTAGTLSVDSSISAEIELTEDQDWFAVTLEAGKEYQIDLEGSATDAGTLSDPSIVGGYGPDGVLIVGAFNDDGGIGSNSQLIYTPTIAGTYYLAASGIGGSTGTYKVSVKNLSDVDDYENSISTAGRLNVDGNITATIGKSQDEDWFAITLQAGTSYQFDLEGSASNAGTLSDPFLAGLYDFNGVSISDTFNDDGGEGTNSRLTYTPSSSGTFFVAAKGIANLTGTYTLSAKNLTSLISSTDSIYTYQDSTPLILNSSLSIERLAGTITSSSVTAIEFLETVTGKKYTVRMEGTFEEASTNSLLELNGTVNTITFKDITLQEVKSLSFSEGREVQSVIDDWRANFLDSANSISSSTGNYDDVIDAGAGNDVITLNSGNDTLDGGAGIDTSVYNGNRADYAIAAVSEGFSVSDSVALRDGTDLLTNVERLTFDDGKLALDLDGSARDAARIYAVIGGAENVTSPAAQSNIGQFISILDAGIPFEDLMQIALDSSFQSSTPSSISVVNLLFQNLAGFTPTSDVAQPFVDLLDNGTYTATSLSVLAANDPITDNAIDLVGLATLGLPYI